MAQLLSILYIFLRGLSSSFFIHDHNFTFYWWRDQFHPFWCTHPCTTQMNSLQEYTPLTQSVTAFTLLLCHTVNLLLPRHLHHTHTHLIVTMQQRLTQSGVMRQIRQRHQVISLCTYNHSGTASKTAFMLHR